MSEASTVLPRSISVSTQTRILLALQHLPVSWELKKMQCQRENGISLNGSEKLKPMLSKHLVAAAAAASPGQMLLLLHVPDWL